MRQDAEDSFTLGLELVRQVAGDEVADRALASHQLESKGVLDELMDWSVETSFGFLFQRAGLTMRDRAIALLGVDIAALVSRDALAEHTRFALRSGLTPDEIYEICFLLVWYCGRARVREALDVITAVVAE